MTSLSEKAFENVLEKGEKQDKSLPSKRPNCRLQCIQLLSLSLSLSLSDKTHLSKRPICRLYMLSIWAVWI